MGDYEPTKADNYRKMVMLNGSQCQIDIMVVADQEYQVIRDNYVRSGEGFLLVFSLVDRETFEAARELWAQILRVKGSQIPVVLVGNKVDLADKQREVLRDEAEVLAQSWGATYFETSAKTKVNVENVYFDLISKIQERKGVVRETREEKVKKKQKCLVS